MTRPHRLGDDVEHLGHVAAGLVLHPGYERDPVQVAAADAVRHVVDGVLDGDAEPGLAYDLGPLGGGLLVGLIRDVVDGLEQ